MKTGTPKSRNRPAPPVVAPSEEVKLPIVSKDEREDKRRWPAIRAEEKLKDWGSEKVTIIDGKSEFHFGWRKCLEWIQEEYDITPKKKLFEE